MEKAFIIANSTAPLFLTTQQLSLWIPNLQAVPVNYVMICPKDSAASIANSSD
jgi:hypothetical protein